MSRSISSGMTNSEILSSISFSQATYMPASKAIIHVSKSDYGALSPYILKLGYQVEWAIPVHKALLFFSNATRNDIIRRSIATVIEAEQSGGNMEDVLESITASLIEIKKIKEQRRASVHSQILQSYVIFFIFLGVMIVVQNLLVPYLMGTGDSGGSLFSPCGLSVFQRRYACRPSARWCMSR